MGGIQEESVLKKFIYFGVFFPGKLIGKPGSESELIVSVDDDIPNKKK